MLYISMATSELCSARISLCPLTTIARPAKMHRTDAPHTNDPLKPSGDASALAVSLVHHLHLAPVTNFCSFQSVQARAVQLVAIRFLKHFLNKSRDSSIGIIHLMTRCRLSCLRTRPWLKYGNKDRKACRHCRHTC